MPDHNILSGRMATDHFSQWQSLSIQIITWPSPEVKAVPPRPIFSAKAAFTQTGRTLRPMAREPVLPGLGLLFHFKENALQCLAGIVLHVVRRIAGGLLQSVYRADCGFPGCPAQPRQPAARAGLRDAARR